ncbi:hypothetical protein [Deinococcus rhizophilus]|uniref:hypothetical protein n=1 Tax=Deinococcus rhizophilus TaxID=3049544 RepID=UPI002552860C|nr:hypothetical protein [Deinococcus rhizophilus]
MREEYTRGPVILYDSKPREDLPLVRAPEPLPLEVRAAAVNLWAASGYRVNLRRRRYRLRAFGRWKTADRTLRPLLTYEPGLDRMAWDNGPETLGTIKPPRPPQVYVPPAPEEERAYLARWEQFKARQGALLAQEWAGQYLLYFLWKLARLLEALGFPDFEPVEVAPQPFPTVARPRPPTAPLAPPVI